jgi:hypothetical protein
MAAASGIVKARDWEQTFTAWSKPSSDAEQEKYEHAESMIRDAIGANSWLANKGVRVYTKGSYANNTNVRQDSDVDISVEAACFFFDDSAVPGFSTTAAGIVVPCAYTFADFKNEVEKALVAKFGRAGVARGDKAFNVHENSYRVDADVIACWGHRRYVDQYRYHQGTEFYSDSSEQIINWPQQQYDNGVAKNKATGGRFKRITRVVKRLRNEMAERGIAAAEPLASYLIECLVWNVPNDGFGHDAYAADVSYALAHLYNATKTADGCSEWGEINELKYLFRSGQPWTREQANAFVLAAWQYVGFE